MSKVIFKFDEEKDLWNYWNKSNFKSSWSNFKVSPEIQKICAGRKFEDCREELVSHLSGIQGSKLIKIHLEAVEKVWAIIQNEFFIRMNKLMKKEFNQDIIAYLTTLGICPYDPNEPSFMFSLFYSLPKSLQTCGHEIMHLYFHKFYWDCIEKEIGKVKTGDLKEALTVLLNLEFRDLWFANDEGYLSQNDLRKFIEEEWKKEKDFDSLIKKCINYMR